MTKQERKKLFLDMMNFRHACRLFDESKKVEQEDIDYILECGRLSPSSIGMEQWKFVLVQNENVKKELEAACNHQKQIGTSSFTVAVLAKISELKDGSDYVDKVLTRLSAHGRDVEVMKKFYSTYSQTKNLASWADAQCHIAGANMMSAAAFIGIDSCPIAGFNPELVSKVLNYSRNDYEISLVIPFGYRAKEAQPKLRLPMQELLIIK